MLRLEDIQFDLYLDPFVFVLYFFLGVGVGAGVGVGVEVAAGGDANAHLSGGGTPMVHHTQVLCPIDCFFVLVFVF